MNNIHILDCTLRDGGYCNDWNFGFKNIKKITHGLQEAGIDIVECGFLTNRVTYNSDITKYTEISQIKYVIPQNRDGKIFVAMMNYGEFNVDDIPQCDGSSIDGIRIAFHKKDCEEALKICGQIKEKGYLVFIQPMVSLSYSDNEFLALIERVNGFEPYAFYVVDSFGMMKGKDLTRLFYMIEHNLKEDIWIGFHSHNNMQLAYSNAQQLTQVQTNRNLIIDSSVYGMGRGAGNLNTELFVEYLNENAGKEYHLKTLLTLIDEILNDFYYKNYWGYSLPNYISAVHNAHPNYASYLDEKKTLTIEGMNDIFEMMDDEKKVSYDKEYMENLYLQYMAIGKAQDIHKSELANVLKDKKILLVSPGKSSVEEKRKISDFIDKNTITVSVNYLYREVETNFIFLSNLRRFRELPESYRQYCIVTSNIPARGVYYQTKYRELLNDEEAVRDNAGLMAIRFFMNYPIEGIYLAGFDGYSHDLRENYGSSDMAYITRNAVLDAVNTGMIKVLKEYSTQVKIEFLTIPKHVRI